MISDKRIKEVEGKDYSSLTDEEKLIWQYWNSYRESNLWYTMMKQAGSVEAAFNFAKKGKDCILKTLAIQCNIVEIWENDALKFKDANLEADKKQLRIALEVQTETIAYISEPREPKLTKEELNNFISKKSSTDCIAGSTCAPKKNNLLNIQDSLRAKGLKAPAEAGEKTKINLSLKVLDNLFWTGKITEGVYNKKVLELTTKKRKIA